MVALLLNHGAELKATWGALCIWSLALHDRCEFFGFRRRLLGLKQFFLIIPHLEICLELLEYVSREDVNLVEKWSSKSWVQEGCAQLSVIYDCLARLD